MIKDIEDTREIEVIRAIKVSCIKDIEVDIVDTKGIVGTKVIIIGTKVIIMVAFLHLDMPHKQSFSQ